MYELQQVRSVDYYSLILEDREEEFEDLDKLNQYRTRMMVCYRRFIEQVSLTLDKTRRDLLKDWFDFNKDFIGFAKNSELNESLERILVNR